jgi:hypothetical protein
VLDDPLSGLRCRQRLGQQVVHVEHLDVPAAQPRHELVVLALCLLDPDHVVEQQLAPVGRGEPAQRQVRTVHQHLAQFADLRVHPELRHVPIIARRPGGVSEYGKARWKNR